MKIKLKQGPLKALKSEYSRATIELKSILKVIQQKEFIEVVDEDTTDVDYQSIQTIINHIVRSGYGYSNYIRKQFGDSWKEPRTDYKINSPYEACIEIDKMLAYNSETLENYLNLTSEELIENKMMTNCGQQYNIEQLLEHAIVHVLRHSRQIKRFLKVKSYACVPM